ncbi:hypothetical protein P3X46_007511 [Hevea brasiliensis]|uniref:Retrotransposon gag domain-containing protein n=1 Tax=Hevea brasiliensis TaxID=3981 RepID=A0ABQ9MW86_HEVBR|nr:hypothetical protein P3X46_007511 [Hevea brasiliensis]
MANNNNRLINDHAFPSFEDFIPSITRPRVEANNFEFKPSLCQMVQQSQFGGGPTESPHVYLAHFLEISDMLKINGILDDTIRLRLFPFSLKDCARYWLHSLSLGLITTWDELSQAFLAQYFPPSKTTKLRNELTSFRPRDDESLYEAWERYKELQSRCPHHGIPKWMLVQHFYNGVSLTIRSIIDASSGGDLMEKSEDEAYSALDKIAHNNYQWSCKRNEMKKPSAGVYKLDAMSIFNAKFDALTRKIDKLSMKVDSSFRGSSHTEDVAPGNIHCVNDFPSYGQEFGNVQVDFVRNYNQKPVGEMIQQLTSRIYQFATHNRMLENQIAQQTSFSSKAQGKLPSQPENPREHCKAVILRSGKIMGEGKKDEVEEEKKKEDEDKNESTSNHDEVNEEANKKKEVEKEEEEKYVSPPPYKPPLPYPQRFQKAKLDKQFGKFLKVLKKLYINIPFTDAISQMPSYDKFLKEILSNKRRLEDYETVALTEECSALL